MVGSGTTKIKPGIMVALSACMGGGVAYKRKDIEKGTDASGTSTARWETERIITDAVEHDAATKVRGAVRGKIANVCAKTSFGLLCPLENEALLDEAIVTAKKIAAEFNATSVYSKIELFVLKGRIASSDKEATDAIAGELRSLLDEMENAMKNADVEAIRDAAARARQIGQMLANDGGGSEVSDAIKAARKVARQIVARVEKGSEDAKTVLAEIGAEGLAAISTARFAMLGSVSEASEVAGEEMTSVDASRFGGLDLGEDTDTSEEVETPAVVEIAPTVRGVELEIPVTPTPLGMTCPKCKKGLIIRGRGAWGCNRWKVCDFNVSFKNADGSVRSDAEIVAKIEEAQGFYAAQMQVA